MGRSFFDVPAAALPNGGGFVTANSNQIQKNSVTTLGSVRTAALTLETAVSTSLTTAVTGTSGAGSMDAPVKAALSASYSSVTGTIA